LGLVPCGVALCGHAGGKSALANLPKSNDCVPKPARDESATEALDHRRDRFRREVLYLLVADRRHEDHKKPKG
jgi:hypothetical protein